MTGGKRANVRDANGRPVLGRSARKNLPAMGFHDLAAGGREFGLVVAQARLHLGRLADELRTHRFGIAAAGHLLLHGRRDLRHGLGDARQQEDTRDGGREFD